MTVNGNYSIPVTVNGFLCKNCTDVENAKKHIDPAHPRSGPYGIDAKNDPTVNQATVKSAVVFGGSLSGLNTTSNASASPPAPNAPSAASSNGSSTNSQSAQQIDIVI